MPDPYNPSAVILADAPKRYYKLDQVAGWMSNLGSDGVGGDFQFTGTPEFQSPDDTYNNSIEFSGDDYANIPSYNFGQSNTFEFCFRFFTANGSQEEQILNGDIASGRRFIRIYKGTGGGLNTYVFRNGADTGFVNIGTPAPHMDGQWHHFALVVEYVNASLSNVSLYIDGRLRASTTMAGEIRNSPGTDDIIYIANNTGMSGGVKYVGYLKHVAIFDSALTPERVAAHAAAAVGSFAHRLPGIMTVMPRVFRVPNSNIPAGAGIPPPSTGQLWPRKG